MSYESFAAVYDLFMDNVPYDKWTENIDFFLKKYEVPSKLVCDLGCGTGQITRRLRDRGYDMTGIDLSPEMLGVAMEGDSDGILYLCQDMREFELYGTMGAIISACDSINYLESTDDLYMVLSLMKNFLDVGGLFIFDVNTRYKYETVLADNTFAESREEGAFIWENEYDPEEKNNYYGLTLFIGDDESGFERFYEEHVQHAFSHEEILETIKKSGFMELIECVDVDTMSEVRNESERIYYILRRQI